jgi:pimeloyl-ACP methyl ester carboxylesterase
VKRRFWETPKGFLHYVVRGDVTAAPPLVFFHAHPASTEQLRFLAEKIPQSQPLIAVDYFGAGSSDECICDEEKDEYVDYSTYASFVLQICDAEKAAKIIPFGVLTGGSPALELAYLASQQNRVDKVVFYETLYLSPKANAYVENVYIPSIRHLVPTANATHLLKFWYQPDAGPVNGLCMIAAQTDAERVACLDPDLEKNQQKTIDALLNMRTGWQFKMAWTAYNDKVATRLSHVSASSASVLFMYGEAADELQNKFGLDHDWSAAHLHAAVPDAQRTVKTLPGGTEGGTQTNATWMATAIGEFLGTWEAGGSASYI